MESLYLPAALRTKLNRNLATGHQLRLNSSRKDVLSCCMGGYVAAAAELLLQCFGRLLKSNGSWCCHAGNAGPVKDSAARDSAAAR
jgi:hypothetical protein